MLKAYSAEKEREKWSQAKRTGHTRGARMANEVLTRDSKDFSFPCGNRFGTDWEILSAIGQVAWDQTQALMDRIRSNHYRP